MERQKEGTMEQRNQNRGDDRTLRIPPRPYSFILYFTIGPSKKKSGPQGSSPAVPLAGDRTPWDVSPRSVSSSSTFVDPRDPKGKGKVLRPTPMNAQCPIPANAEFLEIPEVWIALCGDCIWRWMVQQPTGISLRQTVLLCFLPFRNVSSAICSAAHRPRVHPGRPQRSPYRG